MRTILSEAKRTISWCLQFYTGTCTSNHKKTNLSFVRTLLHAKKYIKYKVISQASRVKCTRTRPEAEFLDVVRTKVFRVFLLAIHSHLY
jgi:hypothetical protein